MAPIRRSGRMARQSRRRNTPAGVSFHARRLGIEKRDVALLGVFSGQGGVGTAVIAIF